MYSVFNRSSPFHWGSWRRDRQHSDSRQPFGAGVSRQWNTCSPNHVRSPSHASHELISVHTQTHTHMFNVKPLFSRWYKDGKAVTQGEGLRVAASGRQLVVSRAQVSDAARFQCVATNEAGDHARDFHVVVHGTFFQMLFPMMCSKRFSFLHLLCTLIEINAICALNA